MSVAKRVEIEEVTTLAKDWSVLLTRQFRYPAFVNGHDDLLVEVPAGMLEDAHPQDRIKAELEEEAGQTAVRTLSAHVHQGCVPVPSRWTGCVTKPCRWMST